MKLNKKRAVFFAGAFLCVPFLLNSAASAQDAKPAPSPSPVPKASPAAPATPSASPAANPFAEIPEANPADVSSMDAILKAVYNVISGDAGVKRDWNRFKSLFYPGARMIPSGMNPNTKKGGARIMTPEDYINANAKFLEEKGFHETEIARKVDTFGTITHVFSTYEAKNKLTDEKPFMRGINSIQLLNDGTRWWVLTIAWNQESPTNPIPENYLKNK